MWRSPIRKKLKYLFNVLSDDYKNIIQINLNSDPNQYINNLKGFISIKSYLENWEDNKTIEKDNPMNLDFISRGRRTSNSSKKNQHNNHNSKSSNSKNRGKPNGNQYIIIKIIITKIIIINYIATFVKLEDTLLEITFII